MGKYKQKFWKIEVFTTDSGKEELIRIIKMLKVLGILGASRKIEMEEYKEIDGEPLFWDGDGSSKIANFNVSELDENQYLFQIKLGKGDF